MVVEEIFRCSRFFSDCFIELFFCVFVGNDLARVDAGGEAGKEGESEGGHGQ